MDALTAGELAKVTSFFEDGWPNDRLRKEPSMGIPLHLMSLAEYLDWESAQADRNEFFCGDVFAMVGGRRD